MKRRQDIAGHRYDGSVDFRNGADGSCVHAVLFRTQEIYKLD